MMSKERELLKEIMSYFDKGDITIKTFENSSDVAETLYAAQELLAQPEKTEQEPVAWIIGDDIFYSYQERGVPLYTTPPKREPLSEQFISVANQSSLEEEK